MADCTDEEFLALVAMAEMLADEHPQAGGYRCGTPRGAAIHYQLGEKPCQPCLDAAAAYRRRMRVR